VYAGWLIALLAWLLASTQSTGAQLAFIWLCTAPIHALGFKHSIAGSVEAFYLSADGQKGWGNMLQDFVVPSVLGNAIGGVLLVALLNYGQVAAERGKDSG
jgi:formate/nitrite transporter FocA (FNT family)